MIVLGALYKQIVKGKCALNGRCHTEVTVQAKQSKAEGKHQTSSHIVWTDDRCITGYHISCKRANLNQQRMGGT